MLATVKQEIQRYYPHDYLFLEFLKHGGWQEVYHDDRLSRWEITLDGFKFNLDHTQYENRRPGGISVPETVFVQVRGSQAHSRGHPINPHIARITRPEEAEELVQQLMITIYRNDRMRGREYHAVI